MRILSRVPVCGCERLRLFVTTKHQWTLLLTASSEFHIPGGKEDFMIRIRKPPYVPSPFFSGTTRSQVLRYTVVCLQVVPSLFYTTAQVIALKTTINSIFALDPDTVYPVIIVMAVTLMFEWVGGMRCVAITDCIQAAIMILAYLFLTITLKKNYGGWSEIDLASYPRTDFYQTPSWQEQMDFWQFAITCFTFFTLPHLMQRIYAARDLPSLKTAFCAMTCGAWLLMFGGTFVGTVGVAVLAGREGDIANPLTSILEEVMSLGGFPLFVGLITFTASLAAIMSTVDSLLVAISQLVTEEIAYPLYPNSAPETMAWCGRLVSLVSVVFATVLG